MRDSASVVARSHYLVSGFLRQTRTAFSMFYLPCHSMIVLVMCLSTLALTHLARNSVAALSCLHVLLWWALWHVLQLRDNLSIVTLNTRPAINCFPYIPLIILARALLAFLSHSHSLFLSLSLVRGHRMAFPAVCLLDTLSHTLWCVASASAAAAATAYTKHLLGEERQADEAIRGGRSGCGGRRGQIEGSARRRECREAQVSGEGSRQRVQSENRRWAKWFCSWHTLEWFFFTSLRAWRHL